MKQKLHRLAVFAVAACALALPACKESKSQAGGSTAVETQTYLVGGDVTGLDGPLVLKLVTNPPVVGGLQTVTLTADGPYSFAVPLPVAVTRKPWPPLVRLQLMAKSLTVGGVRAHCVPLA